MSKVYILFHETNTGAFDESDGYVDGVYASKAKAGRARRKAIREAKAEGKAVWDPDTEPEFWEHDWRVDECEVIQ